MKKTLTGWVGKTDSRVVFYTDFNYAEKIIITDVYKKRGRKGHWSVVDWPPIEVKVTVETVEK